VWLRKSLATVCPIESIFKKQAVKIINNSLHKNICQLVPSKNILKILNTWLLFIFYFFS